MKPQRGKKKSQIKLKVGKKEEEETNIFISYFSTPHEGVIKN